MEKIGQLITTNGSMAKVQVWRASACGEKCVSCNGGCSTTSIYINAHNKVSAKPGQMVRVEMETKKVMKAASLTYLFPLILLILGIFSGYKIFPFLSFAISLELFAFLIGLTFMGVSFYIVKVIYNEKSIKNSMQYYITKVFQKK